MSHESPLEPLPGALTGTVTVADLLRARAFDDAISMLFEDRVWTWREFVADAAARAAALTSVRRPGPFHIGVLLDNVPDLALTLAGAALSGAVIVGLNPTRRGAELVDDITRTDCQLILTEARRRELLAGLELPVPPERILDVDGDPWRSLVDAQAGAPLPDVPIDPADLLMLIFTSGTSGRPKAVRVSQRRIAIPGANVMRILALTKPDRGYLSMPMFHSGAVMAGWSTCLNSGTSFVLKRRFSASQFIDECRRYGCTWFQYVGKPLAYVLATPERPDDLDNPLRIAMGNEAARADIQGFARRFGVEVLDGYGSTESGANLMRPPETPADAMGVLPDGVAILHTVTDEPCVPARFDERGRMLNPDDAIGELVNTRGPGSFEGYYADEESQRERLRGGMFRSGDLVYRDERGFVFFFGRTGDWLRVDGENVGASSVERVIARHPDVVLTAVYGVPSSEVGDDLMAAVVLRDGVTPDPEALAAFLDSEPDFGTKWMPRYLRVGTELPRTETNKVLKRELVRQRWETTDPVWWRPGRGEGFRALTADDVAAIRARFVERGRDNLLDIAGPATTP